ncbi:MAG: hypothetical protein WAK24_15905, partial [Candidatus Acidiferrales bacterium]
MLTTLKYKCRNDNCNFIFGPSEYEKVEFDWSVEDMGKTTETERTTTQHLTLGAEDDTNDILCLTDPSDLLPCFRTKLSMISHSGKGEEHVEEQAHRGADDWGVEATGS